MNGPDRHPQFAAVPTGGSTFLDDHAVPLTALLMVGLLFWVFKK